MNRVICVFIFVLYTSLISFAGEPSALDILDVLAYGGFGQIKYQFGGEPGGENPDLDDSEWQTVPIGFKWNTPETNVWFRTRIKIPESRGGFSLSGRKMTLHLNVDNGGQVYVNGKFVGEFTWANGHYVLSENVKPGQEFLIAIRGINHIGWGQLKDANIEFSGLQEVQKELQPHVWRLFAAKRIALEMSEQPQYWLKEIEKLAQRVVNSPAFSSGDKDEFIKTLNKEFLALQPLGEEIRKKYQLFCAGYSHIDLAWLWTWKEAKDVTKVTTQSVFNIMERFPDFKYSMGQAHAYRWLEQDYPDLFEKIKEKVDENRWEIVGGMWVEPDCNLPSGESFVRQVFYGKRYFQEKFNKDVKICWIVDSFGYNWNLPQILKQSGFDAFISHKINWNDTNKFPYRFFWWQGPDSSRILAYIPRSGYDHKLGADDLIGFSREEMKEQGLGKEFVIYGVGNHGGGPTMEMLQKAKYVAESPVFPQLNLTTSEDFFNSISEQDIKKLPVWDDELYLEFHRGTYTSQANTKKHNRKLEGQVLTAEKLAGLAALHGEPYPQADLDLIWETLMFNQFHDILPGSSINAVYHDTEIEYKQAEKLAADIIEHSMCRLVEKMDTRGKGEALIVYNPHSWARTSPVTVSLDRLEADKEWKILSDNGAEIPSQKIDKNPLGAKILFMADNVPSYGYKQYRLVKGPARANSTQLISDQKMIGNEYLKLIIDEKTGYIRQLYDIRNQKDVFDEPKGNMLQLRKVANTRDDAWNLEYGGEPVELDSALSVRLVESGPVRATIHVKHSYLGENKEQRSPTEDFPSSFFDQYISLYNHLPYVEVRNHVEWWEEHKMLKAAFPVAVQAATATYEIPYATIERSTGNSTSFEKARFEVPAQRWADLSDGEYGVSLINDCKYGYDIKGNLMRLSLLRAPLDPDPMCDRGYHDFSYAVYPHQKTWREANTTQLGIEFNEPLVVYRAESHKGSLEPAFSLLQVEPENAVVNVFKKARDLDVWILRLYETEGTSCRSELRFSRDLKNVQQVDLLENGLSEIQIHKNSFSFPLKPYQIQSFCLEFK